MNETKKQHVFIIGCKGIPAQYGGYETFVDKLTQYRKREEIQYHVACAVDRLGETEWGFEYQGANCFRIQWKKLGPARAIFYDIDAIRWSVNYIKKNKIEHPIIYILACRIGPFMWHYRKIIHSLGGKLFINPDGHEWLRAKWSPSVRKYWKLSEKLMVKEADLVICDSQNIEIYIQESYRKFAPKTTFIAYGSELSKSDLKDTSEKLVSWYREKGIRKEEYYLIVGRFVPENNYETMIREFIRSHTEKSLVIVTDQKEKFSEELKKKTNYSADERIKFVGTVYDQQLLKKIRENAWAYIHGHEVGGTNPSLLEALGSTKLNLLLDVGFNREVGLDSALYWDKSDGSLANLIDQTERMPVEDIRLLGEKARERIEDEYNWDYIVEKYEKVFLN